VGMRERERITRARAREAGEHWVQPPPPLLAPLSFQEAERGREKRAPEGRLGLGPPLPALHGNRNCSCADSWSLVPVQSLPPY